MRIAGAGDDVYTLTCRAGTHTQSCIVRVHVKEGALPASLQLNRTTYTGKVNEVIPVDLSFTCMPAGAVLPEDATVSVTGGRAFTSALSNAYSFTEPEKLVFSRAGTYAANVEFTGANYSYSLPITITVEDEDGEVPEVITGVAITPDIAYMMPGETTQLSLGTMPVDAAHGRVTWSSSDSAVASVSANGRVTAIGAGYAYVTASIPEYDSAAVCMIIVEEGLTLQTTELERTIFVDGLTRVQLDSILLTEASSLRLNDAPEWNLTRISGNNLTLRAEGCTARNEQGATVYGCAIELHSVSRTGDAVYELTCTAGSETAKAVITVHAVERDGIIPAAVTLTQQTYTADIDELIVIRPEVVCCPENTTLPDGLRVSLQGDALYTGALNAADTFVSQSMSTVSFSKAGQYEANLIYSYANVRYVVPMVFRIRNAAGAVPILGAGVTLNSEALWLVPGETTALNAVFTPANADEQGVTWRSADPQIASVDRNGLVTAVAPGDTIIICTPNDAALKPQTCTIWVEDYLTIETAGDAVSLYKAGDQINAAADAWLSEGTIHRLREAGISPEWRMERVSGSHTQLELECRDDSTMAHVRTTALDSSGTDVIRLVCTAGNESWSAEYTIEVLDTGRIPAAITLRTPSVQAAVNERITIDFTPVCAPAGTALPESDRLWDMYAGLGEHFYDALTIREENGDSITIAFSEPGTYMLTRQYFLENVHYSQVCEITVGQAEEKFDFLEADVYDTSVYIGGTAGTVAEINVTDALLWDVFAGQIRWELERISGSSLTMALQQTDNGVMLFAADAEKTGTDVWRVSACFGEYTDSVDVSIEVKEARTDIPESITLVRSSLSGRIGDWITMPIGAVCEPEGSALPESGDDFWRFEPLGRAADYSTWCIEDGLLKVKFSEPGYYTGTMHYEAGNVRYASTVRMQITDEEDVLQAPILSMRLLNTADTVYTSGETGTAIGVAVMSEGFSTYYAGSAVAYMAEHPGTWGIRVTSGTAAVLGIRQATANTAEIVLNSIKGPGTVNYEVTCEVDGVVRTAVGKLVVSDRTDDIPEPVLKKSMYYVAAGDSTMISFEVLDRRNGAALQSAAEWNVDSFLSAIGYEYETGKDAWQATFYKPGTYRSSVTVTVGNLTFSLPLTVVVEGSEEMEQPTAVLKLPAALTAIEEEAFAGDVMQAVDLRGTHVTQIGAGAFRDCMKMTIIYLPDSVTQIAEDAFDGCLHVTFQCGTGTSAAAWAEAHGIPVRTE